MPLSSWQTTLRCARSCCTAKARASARVWTLQASCPEEGGTGVLLAREDDRLANFAQRVTYDWSLVSAPVIAAIHGNCFGGGLQIALGADIRIAAPDAKLCIMEIKWGPDPIWASRRHCRGSLPIDVAKELTFTGRIVSGSEVSTLGLVTRDCRRSAFCGACTSGRNRAEIPGCRPRREAPLRQVLDEQRHRGCSSARNRAAGRADRQAQPGRRRRGWHVGRTAGFRRPRLTPPLADPEPEALQVYGFGSFTETPLGTADLPYS